MNYCITTFGAGRGGHKNIARLLLEHKANVDAKDNDGDREEGAPRVDEKQRSREAEKQKTPKPKTQTQRGKQEPTKTTRGRPKTKLGGRAPP